MNKVLLTGSRGMVGRNILEHKKSKDYFFLTPTRDELNLLDIKEINEYIKKNKPDIIIHAAGVVGGIEANIKNPVIFLHDNALMGLNIINSSLRNDVPKFINIASSCMYPKEALNPLKEEIILQGALEPTNEGYALAKIIACKLCEYISNSFNNRFYKTVIPCNLYGKYDNYLENSSHMIPAVINKIYKAMLQNNEIEIWGDGKARREFMTASSFADFIYYALKNFKKMPQTINVGLGHDYSILEYYNAISNVIGYEGNFKHDLSKPVGMNQKLVDIKKLKNFGWENKTNLKEGIEEAYLYYKDNYGI